MKRTMDDHSHTKHEGMWQKFTGRAKEFWADLTDDEMMKFEGKYDQAMGYLKQKYGQTAEDFEQWWNEDRAHKSPKQYERSR